MMLTNRSFFHTSRRTRKLSYAAWPFVIPVFLAGCILPIPFPILNGSSDDCDQVIAVIAADVTGVSTETMLPTTLSGTLTGDLEGTYDETILEIFFDGQGVPIAGTSRSVLTLTAPQAGMLVSFNLITVDELIFLTDENGEPVIMDDAPVVIGLRSQATGLIVRGTGGFEDATGELKTDSTLQFTGGSMNLGSLATDLDVAICDLPKQ